MIMSFPLVNENGIVTGAEVTCRLSDIYAIEHMTKWVSGPSYVDENGRTHDGDNREVIPRCVVFYVNRESFEVQADYADLKAKMIDMGEWTER